MANYTKINNFTAKDSLASGNANKRVRGTEFDAEFNAISVAISTKSEFVAGMIMMWSGSIGSIPVGFALCDGTSGTPDLRDRFIVGAGSTFAVNATGGSADAVLPTHTHTATSTVTDPGHAHGYLRVASGSPQVDGKDLASLLYQLSVASTTNAAFTSITVGTTIANAGVSGTNANLPPFYALAYIMKT